MQIEYHLFDVFTDTQFTGNPLAVVNKADLLNSEMMQKIACEFALSETVFISQPISKLSTAKVRIFTPRQELPFAGHPTVGAAVFLGLMQRASAIRLEEKIGEIICVMDKLGKKLGEAHFTIPKLPEEMGQAPDKADIAQTLGLSVEQIGCEVFEPARYSAGLEFMLVPVRDRAALGSIRLDPKNWQNVYGTGHGASVYAFTLNNQKGAADFSARMFELNLPGNEDAATGSAAAALIGLIADNIKQRDGQYKYTLEQGADMGRPSQIDMQISIREGKLVRGGIGGKAILVGQGVLDLDWVPTL